MKSLSPVVLSLLLVVTLAAQAPQTGTKQPDAKAKSAEKPPVAANTARPANPKPPAGGGFEMPKPAPEIERLGGMLYGRWDTEEKHEPSEMLPQGGAGKGLETVRPGPGGLSLISEYKSEGPMGIFSGVGITTWNPAEKAYHIHWTDNSGPGVFVLTGKWEGKDLVFTASDMMAGKKIYARHAFTEITPTTFTYTIDTGSAPNQLKRNMTIKYTKINMEEMRNRMMRGRQ